MDTTTQIYLEVTPEQGRPVLGESTAGGYEKRIDIDSFRFSLKGQKQTLKDVQDQQIKTNLDFETITISKVFDRSSLQLAALMKRPQSERRFSEAKIAVDQQYVDNPIEDKIRNEVLIIYLYSGYIADYKLQTSEGTVGATVKETIELSFHNFQIVYYAENRSDSGHHIDEYRTEAHVFQTDRPEQEA